MRSRISAAAYRRINSLLSLVARRIISARGDSRLHPLPGVVSHLRGGAAVNPADPSWDGRQAALPRAAFVAPAPFPASPLSVDRSVIRHNRISASGSTVWSGVRGDRCSESPISFSKLSRQLDAIKRPRGSGSRDVRRRACGVPAVNLREARLSTTSPIRRLYVLMRKSGCGQECVDLPDMTRC